MSIGLVETTLQYTVLVWHVSRPCLCELSVFLRLRRVGKICFMHLVRALVFIPFLFGLCCLLFVSGCQSSPLHYCKLLMSGLKKVARHIRLEPWPLAF